MKQHTHHTEHPPIDEKGNDQKATFSPIITPEHKTESGDHENLKTLIEKNIKWSQVIYNQNRKIQRRLSWIVFGSYLKLFLILIPVILGVIYLPPLISDFWAKYGEMLGGGGQTLQEYFKLLKSMQ